jgi:hypothetical protein
VTQAGDRLVAHHCTFASIGLTEKEKLLICQPQVAMQVVIPPATITDHRLCLSLGQLAKPRPYWPITHHKRHETSWVRRRPSYYFQSLTLTTLPLTIARLPVWLSPS